MIVAFCILRSLPGLQCYILVHDSTEVIKIQGERPQITGTPPPTAQTPGPNWLIFWLEAPHLILSGRTEAIFEFRIWGGDMGTTLKIQTGPSGPENGPISQPQIRNSKIASVRPNRII